MRIGVGVRAGNGKRRPALQSGGHGIRTPLENTGKTGVSDESGAQCGALGAQNGALAPELRAIIDAWPILSDAIKAGILALVRAGTPGESGE